MTAQISDQFFFLGQQMSLAGIRGDGLFEPADYGFEPQAISSACWRGYWCVYAVEDSQLKLKKLTIGLNKQAGVPELAGTKPSTGNKELPGRTVYEPEDFSVPFSGGLLLGSDFIQSMYVHMGFHPAYKYEMVYELIFDKGQLTETHNRSKKMAEFREMLANRELKPGLDANTDEVKDWIEKCFSLNYTRID